MKITKNFDIKKIAIWVVAAIILISVIGLIWYFASISKVNKNDQ